MGGGTEDREWCHSGSISSSTYGHPSLSPSLLPFVPPSLFPSLSSFLPLSLPPSFPSCLPSSLPPSLPPSLRASLPLSLPSFLPSLQAYLHGRPDLVDSLLVPCLLEAHSSQLSLMESLHVSFTRHSLRLAVVREEKQKKQEAILGELVIVM